MENMAAAIDALGSYDVELTRKALSFLVKGGFDSATKYILPLTVHPDVAIRFFAKKAVRIMRARQTKNTQIQASKVNLESATEQLSATEQSQNVEEVSVVKEVSTGREPAGSSSPSSFRRYCAVRNHHTSPAYRRASVVI